MKSACSICAAVWCAWSRTRARWRPLQLVDTLEEQALLEQLLESNRSALDSGMQGLGELGPAIGELRDTLGALRSFSRRLEQDPTGYLLRNDSIKEFQP